MTQCNCWEYQRDFPEKFGDLTFDAEGHCSKCVLGGQDSAQQLTRWEGGKIVYSDPWPDEPYEPKPDEHEMEAVLGAMLRLDFINKVAEERDALHARAVAFFGPDRGIDGPVSADEKAFALEVLQRWERQR